MATPSHDGSARGATSMDRATPLPRRPETTPRRLSVSPVPLLLALDETVPSRHRARRYRTAHTPPATEERMGFIAEHGPRNRQPGLRLGGGTRLVAASTAILHAVFPDRRIDAFRALHEPLAVGLLFGLGVLWLLPPHPWEVEPARSGPKKRRSFRAGGGLMAPFDPQVLRLLLGGLAPTGRGRRDRQRSLASRAAEVLRFWQAGHSRPVWPHQRGAKLSPCSTREPPVLGSLGDVLIHRPSLVAWPVGSEWRNQRPVSVINSTQGAKTDEYEAIHEQEGGGHRPRRGAYPRCCRRGLRLLHDDGSGTGTVTVGTRNVGAAPPALLVPDSALSVTQRTRCTYTVTEQSTGELPTAASAP